jgi:hypothetical protein
MRLVLVVDVADEHEADAVLTELIMNKVDHGQIVVGLLQKRSDNIEVTIGQGIAFTATLVDVERGI